MSYGGFEYNQGGGGGGFGGFDVMSGFGGGGGGFGMDMNGGGFMGGQDAPKSAEKKSSKDKSSLISVTIKQLNNAVMDNSTDTHKIDGFELATVRIMGLVETVEEHATNCNYRINDGTGIMECKLWIEKDAGGRHQRTSEYSFVKVDGSLRDYEGRKHLLIYSIKKIEDWNEMTHHFLDVILVHLQHTRGPIPGSKHSISTSVPLSQSSYHSPFSHAPVSYTNNSTSLNSTLPVGRNLNSAIHDAVGDSKVGVKEKVLKVFHTYGSQTPQGLSIVDATRILQADGLSFDIISKTIQFLTDEGLLYTTIDEDHYQTTESM